MKTLKMSLISYAGEIVNVWSVPVSRRQDALEHALDRAEQEGHAGVLWAVFSDGKTHEFAFDSLDPLAIKIFTAQIQPFMTPRGFDIDRFLKQQRVGEETAYAGDRDDKQARSH